MPTLRSNTCPLLTEQVVKLLHGNDIKSVEEFLSEDTEHLIQSTGLPFKHLLSIRRSLLAEFAAFPVRGDELYDEALSTMSILPTGIEPVDKLLDGGIYTEEVTEIFGSPGAGKTQLCIRTVLNIAITQQQNSIVITTNDSFPVRWVQEYAEENLTGKDVGTIFSRIINVSIFSMYDVLTYLHRLKTLLASNEEFYKNVKVLVIDSVTAIASPFISGNQTDGLGLINHLAMCLKTLTGEFGLAVILTNNLLTSSIDQVRPALGKYWSHVPHTRLRLEACSAKDSDSQELHFRECTVLRSSRRPCRLQARFTIE